jgi:sulfite reductase (NADPH) flavoprotein alpha-component
MSEPASPPSINVYSRKNPFLTELRTRRPLTLAGSEKETVHMVLSLEGSGIRYTPGDSLGVIPSNSPRLVDEVIALLGLDPHASVRDRAGMESIFREALLQKYVLNRANKKIMTGLAERIAQGEQRNRLMELVDNDQLLSDYIHSRDYVDILSEFRDARFETADDFLAQLSPISPRLYSIASCQSVHPDEVHLCVAVVRYETLGRQKTGLATGYLSDLVVPGTKSVPVYVQESRTFRLPDDSSRDIIMCGPGTGIAPFRAFLEARVLSGASGRNWLFFGEQHRASDFFYEKEFDAWLRDGKLHRLDLAFSRDQAEKVYVQHRMREQGKELWSWLSRGAYFYVCGDARRMAKDVHAELIGIAEREGVMSAEKAAEYVNVTLMKTERRYLRDVY